MHFPTDYKQTPGAYWTLELRSYKYSAAATKWALHVYDTEMYPGRILVSSDAETVIQDAQNSSECVNLDAQIMILDV